MTYELAKKLKDAGFPFPTREGIYALGEPKEVPIAPTLSELIEACGDEFNCLQKGWKKWECGDVNGGSGSGQDAVGGFFEAVTEGDTPEEAVANLWLRLNEK